MDEQTSQLTSPQASVNQSHQLTNQQSSELASQSADDADDVEVMGHSTEELIKKERGHAWIGPHIKLTMESARHVLAGLLDGKSVLELAKEIKVGPGRIYAWAESYPVFGKCFQRARKLQAHVMVEQGLQGLKDNSKDLYNDGKRIAVNTAQVQRDFRLGEMYKWWAGRLNPLYAEQPQTLVQVNQFVDQPASETRDDWLKRKAKEQAKQ